MKLILFSACLVLAIMDTATGQQANRSGIRKKSNTHQEVHFPRFSRSLLLEDHSDTTANVSFGHIDSDGHLDLVLVKGRHWPIADRILLGDGTGGIRKSYPFGEQADRSYTGGLADFNGDGYTDIAVSNDEPDRKLVYFNDGKGNFTIGSEFGVPSWPTRNVSLADINNDGLTDIILANRTDTGHANYVCLNAGKGQFGGNCIPFANYPCTTISPTHLNGDSTIDLVVPHRDGGQSFVYLGSSDSMFADNRRIPFGPADARIRMAAVADVNDDRIPDIIAIDEKRGVSLHTGRKDRTFAEGIILPDPSKAPYALLLSDVNSDGRVDIVVGHVEGPSTLFYNQGGGRDYKVVSFGDARGTVYGFAAGDFNEDGGLDLAAARSDAPNVLYFGDTKRAKKH